MILNLLELGTIYFINTTSESQKPWKLDYLICFLEVLFKLYLRYQVSDTYIIIKIHNSNWFTSPLRFELSRVNRTNKVFQQFYSKNCLWNLRTNSSELFQLRQFISITNKIPKLYNIRIIIYFFFVSLV